MEHNNIEEQKESSSPSSRWKGLAAIWQSEDKSSALKRWAYDSRKQLLLTVGGVAVLTGAIWGGTTYVEANTFPYVKVYNGEQLVGEIASIDQLDKLYEEKLAEVQAANPHANIKIDTSEFTTEVAEAYKAKPATEETLAKLSDMISVYAEGVELKINGQSVAIVKDQDTADKLLAQYKNQYNPDINKEAKVSTLSATKSSSATKTASRVESVSLRESVTTEVTQTTPDKVLAAEEVMQLLTTGDAEKVIYTVEEGDSLWSIAMKMKVSLDTIYRNNPGIGEGYLKIGQEILLAQSSPLLTVRTVEKYTEYIATEPQVEVREDPDMRAGESKVIREGKQGLKRMSYRLISDNGELAAEEWIDQEVIEPAVSRIIVKGTKVVSGEGSGNFAYPVKGATLSSGYGTRWGTLHKGLDFTSSNKNIYASDEGVIEFAGWKNGYGNTIIINHKNGYKTLYGHMSELKVSEGEVVQQGAVIGIMGTTGHSTGVHLHFEIHKNGSVVNPSKYL